MHREKVNHVFYFEFKGYTLSTVCINIYYSLSSNTRRVSRPPRVVGSLVAAGPEGRHNERVPSLPAQKIQKEAKTIAT